MFPAWYGPPQPDWLPQIRLTGFPMFDGVATPKPLDEDLPAFCRAGEKPVAFTFGTGVPHATHLYHASVEACRLLNLRGIVLTKHAAQLPSPLPPTVRHVPFAPFRELFPRCAAVVHHGGIGTVAKCLEAGVPQVILPIAYDQKDNAVRVKRLGTGDWVRAGRASGPRIAELVKRVATPEVKVRCGAIAARFAGEDALGAAADAVEALVRSESSTPAGRSAP
jgi:UDP:flavonoid glycosyltransferase YjiC (YdhE family)